MKNKRIALEWLFFLGAFLFGMTTIPLLLLPFLFTVLEWGNFSVGAFYHPLLSLSRESVITWAVVLGPYLLIQLIRSIIWSIKTLKEESD